MPNPAGPAWPDQFRHYWFSLRSGSFWPVQYGNSDHEPFTAWRYTAPADAGVLMGCRDGYIRHYDDTHETDEGYEIESYVAFGPFPLGRTAIDEGLLAEVVVTAAEDSGPISWWLYVGDSPQACFEASVAETGMFQAGRNYVERPRRRGSWAMLVLGNGATDRPWALESVHAVLLPRGRQRLD